MQKLAKVKIHIQMIQKINKRKDKIKKRNKNLLPRLVHNIITINYITIQMKTIKHRHKCIKGNSRKFSFSGKNRSNVKETT